MSTGIQWTDETWNPVVGCSQVSAGCDNCYAKTVHDRRRRAFLAGKKLAPQYAEPFETVQLKPERLTYPLSWRAPRRIFVNSVSDLFHRDVPDDYLVQVFAVMAVARRHTFQVLTKRAGRMRSVMADPDFAVAVCRRVRELQKHPDIAWMSWPLPNVCLGVSVENRAALGRVVVLRETNAAVRMISFEPLLEAVQPNLARIDWAIVGGESGDGARPFDLAWARAIIERCRLFGTSAFVKQLGAAPVDAVPGMEETRRVNEPFMGSGWAHLKLNDRHGGDMDEWPADLRVREFPERAA